MAKLWSARLATCRKQHRVLDKEKHGWPSSLSGELSLRPTQQRMSRKALRVETKSHAITPGAVGSLGCKLGFGQLAAELATPLFRRLAHQNGVPRLKAHSG